MALHIIFELFKKLNCLDWGRWEWNTKKNKKINTELSV